MLASRPTPPPHSKKPPPKKLKTAHPSSLAPAASHQPTPSTNPPTMQDTEVDLFPAGTTNNEPQTPPRNDHLNAAAPGELSPPRSQGNSTADAGPAAAAAMNGNGPAFAANGTTTHLEAAGTHASFAPDLSSGFDGNDKGAWQPGEWKSKKSQDEMARAWEFVVDKEWSAREYGDVVMRGNGARGVA